MMIRLFYTLVILALLTACAPMAQVEPVLELKGDWIVGMTQSGGFAGLHRSVEINSEGILTVIDERTGQTVTEDVTDEELAALEGIVSQLQFEQVSAPESYGCADCFIYELNIQTEGGGFSVVLNDISLPDSGLEPLVSFLRTHLQTALK